MNLSKHIVLCLVASAWLLVPVLPGCRRGNARVVVVYTALDRMFSEPILDEFEKRTGIAVLAKYDTEATKTVGLVNAIRAESARPRCDVFWNNELVHTVGLKREGLLEQYRPAAADPFPPVFRDPDGYWCGFAARARVLLVNTNIVPVDAEPDSIFSLADARWMGRIGLAKPLFGTTGSHASCLFQKLGQARTREFFESLKRNDVRIESGNKRVAESVSAGALAFGLTDTDDALGEVESGKPVKIVYPDAGPDQLGVLFLPNTLALIRNAPHAEAGRRLIEYLLSPEVELALANSASAQIPLNTNLQTKVRVKTPREVKAMDVDFQGAAERFDEVKTYIEEFFLK